MKSGCTVTKVAYVLVIIGALNWGLVGLGMLFGSSGDAWNVVKMLLGKWETVEAVVYVLVGVAAVVKLVKCKCSTCKTDAPAAM